MKYYIYIIGILVFGILFNTTYLVYKNQTVEYINMEYPNVVHCDQFGITYNLNEDKTIFVEYENKNTRKAFESDFPNVEDYVIIHKGYKYICHIDE